MNAIEISNLTKRYPGFTLDNLNLTLPSGCILGLVGENGAGKSTSIKLMLGAGKPDSGIVRVLGGDIRKDGVTIRQDVGVVLDESNFPALMNARQIGKMMAGIYKNWQSEVFHNYLGKLKVPEEKNFKTFSKGMKMKLAFAVALSHQAKLLILDEATTGLDPVVRDEILDILNDFTRDEGHSVLISSHIVSDLEKICDYIAFLHRGRLMLCQEKDELLERYAFVQGTREQIDGIDGVIGRKDGRFGVEAIALRENLPQGVQTSPVTIEELFVFMVKEDR